MLLLSLPLVMIGLNPDQLRTFLLGTYLLLISLAFLNMTFAALMHRGRVYLFSLLLLPVLPFYFGVFLKTVRLYAYISETLWRASRLDDFVPARVRKVLYKD
jgi:hypothetical protein